MKKILTITLIICAFNISNIIAQNRALQRNTERFVYYNDIYDDKSIFDPKDPEKYDGTPYYEIKFLPGSIYLDNDLLESNVALRYNALADEIEYKESTTDDDEDAKALIKSKDIYAKIAGDTFVFIPSKGYYIVVFDGNNFSLLKKVTKKYYPAKESENSYDRATLAKFADRSTYNIYTKEGLILEFPKSKSKKLKIFGKSEKLVKSYIKEHKLDLNNEKDLKSVIMHLDGVEGARL